MITFYECGQGDASYIDENGIELFVDLGTSQFRWPIPSNIDLMISHSHADHMSGGTVVANSVINMLYVPAYFPEYAAIINRLLNRPNFPFPNNIKFVYEGMSLYSGLIRIMNPPLDPWNYWPEIQDDAPSIDSFLQDLGDSIRDRNKDDFIKSIYESVQDFNRDQISREESLLFIERMLARLAQLYFKGEKNLIYAINSFRNYDANMLSIVFLYTRDNGKVFLFTGDACKKNFYRIMNNNSNALSCDLLKVPHHGSKKSLNKRILSSMNPSAAVISHDNGLFGTAIDPHPNKEIIHLLRTANIDIYPTNDVVKNGSTIIAKHTGPIPGFPGVRIL